MSILPRFAAAVALTALSHAACADTVLTRNGDDTFLAGAQVSQTLDTVGDTFVAARSARLNGAAQGDLHVSGLDVSVTADAAEDLYVMGGTVVIRGSVAEDLSAMGFSVHTESTSDTKGNVRLMGNSVTVEGIVGGALSVTGRDVFLNAPVKGDVRVSAQTLSFGPDATVDGTLTYSTREKTAVPATVAPAERVFFEKNLTGQMWEDWHEMGRDMPVFPAFLSMFFGFLVSLLFFIALLAVILAFMPRRLAAMRRNTANAPWQTLLLGVIGLSVLFGMVPITAMTIVGLPFAPIVVLAIVVAWMLGYALGAYSVAMRIWTGLGGDDEPGNLVRLMVFAAAITFIALLNYIPFVGWIINYMLVLLGIGAITRAVFQSMISSPDVVLDVDMKPLQD